MAVDLGTRRVGLAVSDPLKMIASPLATLAFSGERALVRELLQFAREWDVERVIVGLPLREDGTEGEGCQRSRSLARRLQAAGMDTRLWDERYTSVSAEALLREGGINRKKAGDRIDRIAASILLEDYMKSAESRNPGGTPPGGG